MPTIEAKTGIVTHINVFTVPVEKQQQLVDQLIETVNAAKQVPGWISASIHRRPDGTHVAARDWCWSFDDRRYPHCVVPAVRAGTQ